MPIQGNKYECCAFLLFQTRRKKMRTSSTTKRQNDITTCSWINTRCLIIARAKRIRIRSRSTAHHIPAILTANLALRLLNWVARISEDIEPDFPTSVSDFEFVNGRGAGAGGDLDGHAWSAVVRGVLASPGLAVFHGDAGWVRRSGAGGTRGTADGLADVDC